MGVGRGVGRRESVDAEVREPEDVYGVMEDRPEVFIKVGMGRYIAKIY